MLIEKLKRHLESTPLGELREEWKLVERFGNIGPMAIDLVSCWSRTYLNISQPGCDMIFWDKAQKEIKKETPEYSEFFFNIVL